MMMIFMRHHHSVIFTSRDVSKLSISKYLRSLANRSSRLHEYIRECLQNRSRCEDRCVRIPAARRY